MLLLFTCIMQLYRLKYKWQMQMTRIHDKWVGQHQIKEKK